MRAKNWDDEVGVQELPFGREALGILLGVTPGGWHFDPVLLSHWLRSDSPFFQWGSASLLFVENAAALLVSHDSRMTRGRLVAFSALRVNERLSSAEQVSVVGRLLQAAAQWGRSRGAERLGGPLMLSTWNPYRVLADDRPNETNGFPGEGVEPAAYNLLYRAAGLQVTDRYVTTAPPEDPDYWMFHLDREAGISSRRAGRVAVLPLSPGDGLRLAPQVFEWLNSSFVHNPYFVALSGAEFGDWLMQSMPGGVEPVRLGAFDGDGTVLGVLAGFVAENRGILKTVAVRPDAQGTRCAMALTFEFHRRLFHRGITQVQHALMHVNNSSARMSSKYARPVRHYVLYGTHCA